MPKKKDIWDQIKNNLELKLKKSEFKTWFSEAKLEQLNPNLAIISVPNKFIASWICDNYLIEVKKSFKKIAKRSPDIHFSYNRGSILQEQPKSRRTRRPEPYHTHNLNPSMTFSRFIEGDCNRLACSSALEIANKPASQYNPLLIYADAGLGKTHLLHAIGNHVFNSDPYSRVKYLSCDKFTSDFTYSMKNKDSQKVREKYCNVDLLLFDDVQLLDNREKTQEEFLSIFKTLYHKKKQIVLSSSKPPNNLRHINPQLKSRLGSGLLTEIKWPDHITKHDIIKHKIEEDNVEIPEDVIFFLSKANTDIKTLIKNIVRIETYASLNHGDINISRVKSIIKEKDRPNISMDDIKAVTAGCFNITVGDLVSNKKKRVYSYPRQVAMYLSRKYTSLSFKEIGDAFGPKDHSTVIYAIRRIEKMRDQEADTLQDLRRIENLLG